MLPKVIQAKSLGNYRIEIVFDNRETKIFDASPYLDYGIFRELKNPAYFDSVAVQDGTLVWKNGQDFGPDSLYVESRISTPDDATLILGEKPPEKYGQDPPLPSP